MKFKLGRYQQAVDERVRGLAARDAAARIFRRDTSFWGGDSARRAVVERRLGWIGLASAMRGRLDELRAFAHDVAGAGFTDTLLLGMGGSSLAPEVLRGSIERRDGYPALHVLDTTDPATILRLAQSIDLARALFVVSSKSGTTIEVECLYAYFRDRVQGAVGADRAGSHFIAITDEGTPLQRLAADAGFRRVFTNPSDIGGRYSALSYFGLVPAAVSGVDVARVLDSAAAAEDAAKHDAGLALRLGVALGELALAGRDKCTFLVAPEVASFGLWLEQLIAESLGKDGKGILPVVHEPPGTPRKYGKDRMFVQIRMEGGYNGENDSVAGALVSEGHPLIVIDLEDGPYDLGREFFRWELATAVAGAVIGVNPFDEPNVQESKDNTARVLREFEASHLDLDGLDRATPAVEIDATRSPELARAMTDLFAELDDGAYLAIQAYTQETPQSRLVFGEMRGRLRDQFGVATTLGYGPRYLHSTGQLHKGGPPRGVFLQVTASDHEDVPIPGRTFTFGQLKRAQAIGDLESLAQRRRPVLRVHCGAGVAVGLGTLQVAVRDALRGRPATLAGR